MKPRFQILLAVYIAGVVITFGHAWHRDYSDVEKSMVPMIALTSSALWPLYWSEVFWRKSP